MNIDKNSNEHSKETGAGKIIMNPNPRANENITANQEKTEEENVNNANKVGSEITDGEDA